MSKFHAVLYSQRSFMGGVHMRKSSQVIGRSASSISLSPLTTPQDVSADSEFFRFTPNTMLVEIGDILKAMPFGRMQKFVIFMHFLMFISSSFIIYNYCFFLMSPTYLCTYTDPNDSAKTI